MIWIKYLQLLQHVAIWFVQCPTHQCVHPTCIPHHQELISVDWDLWYLWVVHSYRTAAMWYLSDPNTICPGCLQCTVTQLLPLFQQHHLQACQKILSQKWSHQKPHNKWTTKNPCKKNLQSKYQSFHHHQLFQVNVSQATQAHRPQLSIVSVLKWLKHPIKKLKLLGRNA